MMPATKADPPSAARPGWDPTTPTETPRAPKATAATAPSRSRASLGRAAAKAAAKNGMTPAIAVVAPPASARWRGSQAPRRSATGRNIARTAPPRKETAVAIAITATNRSDERSMLGARRRRELGSITCESA